MNARNNYGCTALWYACNDWRPVLVKTLLLAGADHTIATNSRFTIRELAKMVEHGDGIPLIEVSPVCDDYTPSVSCQRDACLRVMRQPASECQPLP